jgi:hypothetical protein
LTRVGRARTRPIARYAPSTYGFAHDRSPLASSRLTMRALVYRKA